MDKTQETLEQWCSAEGIEFESAEAEEAYKQRTRRVTDAIQLKVPDRVPIVPSWGTFPARASGYTCEDVMFDRDKAHEAYMKALKDLQPDIYYGADVRGPIFEALGYRQLLLPGRGVPVNSCYQFVEDEYVTADEFYEGFLDDPADFMIRTYMPRICNKLEPLKNLNPIYEPFGYEPGLLENLPFFGTPEGISVLQALQKAGVEALKWAQDTYVEYAEVRAMGFPTDISVIIYSPFDIIGDFMRGTRGIMLDMYRRPDKLMQAMEKILPMLIKMGLRTKETGTPGVMIPLHKGAEGFMSIEQYKTFYWPTLRKLMMGLIDEGLVPVPVFEGEYTSRLEIIKDIARGKAVYCFERVDLHKAKEILGDTACFKGNVPTSLLCTGTPDKVKAYVKELIDIVGKDGGLIVDCAASIENAKYENVKAMIDFAKEYGVYK